MKDTFDVKSALTALGYKIHRPFPNTNLVIDFNCPSVLVQDSYISREDVVKIIERSGYSNYVIFVSHKLECSVIKVLNRAYADQIFELFSETIEEKFSTHTFYHSYEGGPTYSKLLIDETDHARPVRITLKDSRVNVNQDTEARLMIILKYLTMYEPDGVQEGYSHIGKLM